MHVEIDAKDIEISTPRLLGNGSRTEKRERERKVKISKDSGLGAFFI